MSDHAGHPTGGAEAIPPFLARGGELGRRIAGHDWAATPLGPISTWPVSLRSIVGHMVSANSPMALFWGHEAIMLYNDPYAEIAAGRHPSILGSRLLESWPEVAEFNAHVLDVGLKGGSLAYSDIHLVLFRNGAAEDVWLDLNYNPVLDDAGRPAGVLATVAEVTKRHMADEEARRSRERLTEALNAAGVIGIWDWQAATDLAFSDARFSEFFSIDPRAARRGLPRGDFFAAIHPEDRDDLWEAIERAAMEGSDLAGEYRLTQPGGGFRWVMLRGTSFRDASGRTIRLSGAAVDITGRKDADESRRLLVRELHHRVKNTFAVIGGMITMTARSASSVQEMATILRGRLVALAGAHDLIRPAITAELDHTEQTTLADLFTAILTPHLYYPEQFTLEAPRVEIGVSAATNLALVLHELATNAAKYGSLSTPKGTLHVKGTLTETELRLDWVERGGPLLSGPPQHQGFGSRLAGMSVSGQLAGSIDFQWNEEGLEAFLVMSLDRLAR